MFKKISTSLTILLLMTHGMAMQSHRVLMKRMHDRYQHQAKTLHRDDRHVPTQRELKKIDAFCELDRLATSQFRRQGASAPTTMVWKNKFGMMLFFALLFGQSLAQTANSHYYFDEKPQSHIPNIIYDAIPDQELYKIPNAAPIPGQQPLKQVSVPAYLKYMIAQSNDQLPLYRKTTIVPIAFNDTETQIFPCRYITTGEKTLNSEEVCSWSAEIAQRLGPACQPGTDIELLILCPSFFDLLYGAQRGQIWHELYHGLQESRFDDHTTPHDEPVDPLQYRSNEHEADSQGLSHLNDCYDCASHFAQTKFIRLTESDIARSKHPEQIKQRNLYLYQDEAYDIVEKMHPQHFSKCIFHQGFNPSSGKSLSQDLLDPDRPKRY